MCLLGNQFGWVVAWECATANVYDNAFQPLRRQFEARRIVLRDLAFQAAAGDPANLTLCARGAWNARMRIETVLSMLTRVSHFKKVMHRGGGRLPSAPDLNQSRLQRAGPGGWSARRGGRLCATFDR